MGEGLLMKSLKLDNKGFSLTELMFAMTILAFGLLALAQMQMMAMRGTTSAREFSSATKICREGMERFKIPGAYVVRGVTGVDVKYTALVDHNEADNDEDDMAPDIKSDTNVSDITYDTIETFVEDQSNPMSLAVANCTEYYNYSGDCDSALAGEWDYVRITNVRNWPLGSPLHDSIMKEVSVIVLWKERGLTRSVSLRTLLGRKDNDFY
jgi:prepilin-type N-terminal cleavage/methylation domain-containing protein